MEIIEKMPDNKRHAILLSGLARNYEDTIGDFKKNLRNRDDVDLFICFWDYLGVRKFEKDHSIKKVDGSSQVVCKDRDAGMLDVKKVERDYNPTAIKIYDFICDLQIPDFFFHIDNGFVRTIQIVCNFPYAASITEEGGDVSSKNGILWTSFIFSGLFCFFNSLRLSTSAIFVIFSSNSC